MIGRAMLAAVLWAAAALAAAPPAAAEPGELEALRAEVAALRARVAELEDRTADARPAGAPASSAGSPLALSRDGWTASLYGFLTSEMVWESSGTGGDRFLNLVPHGGGDTLDGDFFLSAHATRLGLQLSAPESAGVGARGLLEIDFDTDDGGPRIRHAFASLHRGANELLLGQTWAVVAQANPHTVNSDNLFNLGNAYERVPQVRVAHRRELANGALRAEAAVLRFFGGFDQQSADGIPLAVQAPDGVMARIESSGLPTAQARLAWQGAGNGAFVALSGSVGRVRVGEEGRSDRHVPHRLVALELGLPLPGPFSLLAEAFWGRAPGFNAGVGQSVVLADTGAAHAVEAWGGFVEIAAQVTPRTRCHLLAGLDDPKDRVAGRRVAVARNWTWLGNCFWEIRRNVELALEVQGVHTDWQVEPAFEADDVRVTQAVYLNF